MLSKDIRAIEILATAVELGSLRRAAASQNVTAQAVSQTVAQLEESLGVRLLHRTTRSLSLTEEGQQLLDATQPALVAFERALAQARLSKDEIAGPLRIVGPRSWFAPVLWPVFPLAVSQNESLRRRGQVPSRQCCRQAVLPAAPSGTASSTRRPPFDCAPTFRTATNHLRVARVSEPLRHSAVAGRSRSASMQRFSSSRDR
ncbi:LysR family transcriptional regulator [Caballeronia temeraria]|uniref:LysR family transcriptional regulator n=1 Tax=Caballeronia temeraria TaxID=1777137 RepID=A0A158DJM9_9BURK|nr:LysR family transcriptional regulator [Caballeronia temeraria]